MGALGELAREVQERFLEVVVGLRGDLVVLDVLLAMEVDLLGLDLAILHVHLRAARKAARQARRGEQQRSGAVLRRVDPVRC